MSLIDLTKDLSNFNWTEYSKAGTGKSPQLDGTTYYERPNPKSLEGMESKFGPIDTPPPSRGPYGVVNTMDGTKTGRGFIKPGMAPFGFTKDMDSFHNKSELEIGNELVITPLSHNIAGVTSDLSYGQVGKKELNLEPQAKGAYGVKSLPISTYSSRQPIEGIPFGAVGGNNTYYGNIDLIAGRKSQFQDDNGNYTTPQNPPFGEEQRTFRINAPYPDNTKFYTINNQFGWSYPNKYLSSHGTAWRGFGLTESVGKQIDENGGISSVIPDFYPDPPSEPKTKTPHPMNKIYLNSEPNYNAPSYLELQFLKNHGETNSVWPYHVLSYTNPNSTGPNGTNDVHPIIRKEIGDRYFLGGGIENWMALQASRTADDITRVESFLETPAGALWKSKQIFLQNLNPREETREWNEGNLLLSIPPLFHATRHGGLCGPETYMDVADFGPIFEGNPPQGLTLKSFLSSKFPKLTGPLNLVEDGLGFLDSGLSSMASSLGLIDFNEEGAGGRLKFLRNKFIVGDSMSFMQSIVNGGDNPFGRTPKIPTQTVFSQRGAYGGGDAHKNTVSSDSERVGSVLQHYQTLKYGDLNKTNGYDMGGPNSLISPGEINDGVLDPNDIMLDKKIIRQDYKTIVDGIGRQGKPLDTGVYKEVFDTNKEGVGLGIIKKGPEGKYVNQLTDKVNILPYGKDYNEASWLTNDFIKFKFYDIENKKPIIFRAILSGISDSITPEWSGTRYIGRPDQVYVYQGAERKVSFNFAIYPKTKQEFPVLLEKLNYLVGLCYPGYSDNDRMIAPFMELTLGDMFVKTPGFLDSLAVNVDDTSTWETDDGLQFPKYITCECSFTYVGQYQQSKLGKHYGLNWLQDNGYGATEDGESVNRGTFVGDNENPTRTFIEDESIFNMEKLFDELGAVDAK